MKDWVRAFLYFKGFRAATEVSKLGYHVDVGAVAEGVYVECGDTEPTKVLAFLRSGCDVGILQYDAEDVLWFRSTPTLQAWLSEKHLVSLG